MAFFRHLLVVIVVLAAAAAAPVLAQTLSAPVVSNTGDGDGTSCNGVCGAAICEAERRVTAATVSSTSTNFRARYSSILAADCGESSQSWSYSMTSAYRVAFSATCPLGYRLTINTQRKGVVLANQEGGNNQGHAALAAVAGSATPSLTTGDLILAAAPTANSGADVCNDFNQTNVATIVGISNNSAINHTLDFNWNSDVSTQGFAFNSGDEGCVMLGRTVSTISNLNCDNYPNLDGCGTPPNPRTQADDGHFTDVTLTCLCGDGVNDGAAAGEQCDEGAANGTLGSCCTSSCQRKTAGSSCRPSAGECDSAEVCDGLVGSCPADGFVSPGIACTETTPSDCFDARCNGSGACSQTQGFEPDTYECRGVSDLCDKAEKCTGSSGTCPVDAFLDGGTTCRISAGSCDVGESCNGANAICPPDGFQPPGTECSDSSTSDCFDAQCNGSGSCNQTQGFEAGSYVCRTANGACDLAEQCSGSAGTCPADSPQPGGTVCRAAASPDCDVAETCDGLVFTCPADTVVPEDTDCTDLSPNDCNNAACDGAGLCGQTQALESNGHVCRAAVGDCDAADACNGISGACPADAQENPGTPCSDSSPGDCFDAQCDGGGSCDQTFGIEASSHTCRPEAGVCDIAELCDGTGSSCPVDALRTDAFVCRSGSECDPAEVCNGSIATCPADVLTNAGVACTDSTAGDCFDARCDGNGSCDQNQTVELSNYVCRPSIGECDPQEACGGVTGICPNDQFVAVNTPCTDTNTNDCFDAQCNGSGSCSQTQALELNGTVCRNAADICDLAETCNGSVGACPGNGFAPSSSECRARVDSQCDVAENCTGSSASCPADLFVNNGTSCNDHSGCTLVDSCQSGSCAGGSLATCSDGFLCTVDACVSTGDTTHTCNSSMVANGSCLINELCYDDNEDNPNNECQACDSGTSQSAWSNKGEGTQCALTYGVCDGVGICDEPQPSCPPDPRTDCRTGVAGSGKVIVRDIVNNDRDSFQWKWNKGEATDFNDFGNPVSSTDYAVCLYDGRVAPPQPQRIKQIDLPAGGVCKNNLPCWRSASSNRKYIFRDQRKPAPFDGINKVILSRGDAGKAKISLRAAGPYVDPPELPLEQQVVVQLVNSRGQCWEGRYSSPFNKADGYAFIDRND